MVQHRTIIALLEPLQIGNCYIPPLSLIDNNGSFIETLTGGNPEMGLDTTTAWVAESHGAGCCQVQPGQDTTLSTTQLSFYLGTVWKVNLLQLTRAAWPRFPRYGARDMMSQTSFIPYQPWPAQKRAARTVMVGILCKARLPSTSTSRLSSACTA